jgi:hypothetical protein
LANAQPGDLKVAFFIDAGMSGSLAPESFDESWGSGGTFGFELGYKASPTIIPGIFIDFNRFNLLDEKIIREAGLEGTGVGLMGGDSKITAYGFNVRLYFNPRKKEARPYFMLGLGRVKMTGSDLYLTYMGENRKVGEWVGDDSGGLIAAGIGLDIYLSKSVSLFADAKYCIAYTDADAIKFLPIRAGLAFY